MTAKTTRIGIEKEIYYNKKSFRSYKVDTNFGELLCLYKSDEIKVSSSYQRLYKWNISQRTKFIESLLLEIPIPPIFVLEHENGKWEVVDGLHRLFTFFSFIGCLDEQEKIQKPKNNWKLQNGDIIKTTKGLTFKDLPLKNQLNLKRAPCSVIVIQTEKENYELRYAIFNRLNAGGTKLSNQNIKDIIHEDTFKQKCINSNYPI